MVEKSRFQKELEKTASHQIVVVILMGCLLFCVAIFSISVMDQRLKQEKHLDSVVTILREIHGFAVRFLEDEDNQAAFRAIIVERESGEKNRLQYQLSRFNIDAPVGMNLILTNEESQIVYSTLSGIEMNLHRQEFNRIAVENARRQNRDIYSTVYYFSGDSSEYVLVCPLYEGSTYIGSVSSYLKEEDWEKNFRKYQYDTILTNSDDDIIYCSNIAFRPTGAGNKYFPSGSGSYLFANDSRYLTDERYLQDIGITVYSFIYSSYNYNYILIGILTILGLGLVWSIMFFHLLGQMAEKTSASVELLVKELRVIRKEDPDHVVQVETGDEIEGIAEQINKMVTSIKDLNQRNLELVNLNNRMEIQNLQAQINPHFIYNTLDNIRYLIAQDTAKADELIERFTHILRYSINNTKQITSLQEDMEYIEDYLVIQKTRFGERFQYQMDIGPECQHIMIPKLLLQPLIENSLKYGFQKKAEIFVKVRGRISGSYLILQVEDNGPGQSEDGLESLRSILRSGEINIVHNGLQNINRRIVLEYGHDSGLTLANRDSGGLTVTLKLWIKEGERKRV